MSAMRTGRLHKWIENHPWWSSLTVAFVVLWVALWAVGNWKVGLGLCGKLEVIAKGNHQTLIVLIHGLGGDGAKMNAVKARIRNLCKEGGNRSARSEACRRFIEADIYQPEYAANFLSNTDPLDIAAQLEENLFEFYSEYNYSNIILIGHSMGDLLIRQAYLIAADRESPAPWSTRVTKIISMAGVNRGLSLDSKVERPNRIKRIAWRIAQHIGRITFTGHFENSLQKGAPFISDLRVQWMRFVKHRENSGDPIPLVAHLIGDKDDVMSKDDTQDLGISKQFHPFHVPGAGHGDLVDFDLSPAGNTAGAIFENVLVADQFTENMRGHFQEKDLKTKDYTKTEIIFVRHGIRDLGDWSISFKNKFENKYTNMHVDAALYPRMPLFPFLFFNSREKRVNAFMDKYTEAMAKFPNASQFHFIGHSNGTYLLTRALEKYKQIKINRVVFAGTVTPRAYNWHKVIDHENRVDEVLNFVGKDDWIVGIFPRLFEWMHEIAGIRGGNFDELGSAGYAGYLYSGPEMHQIDGLGGHSWAIKKEDDKIFQFIRNGCEDLKYNKPSYRPAYVEWLSNLCWLVWLFLVSLVLGGGRLIFRVASQFTDRRTDGIMRHIPWLVVITYGLFVWGLLVSV